MRVDCRCLIGSLLIFFLSCLSAIAVRNPPLKAPKSLNFSTLKTHSWASRLKMLEETYGRNDVIYLDWETRAPTPQWILYHTERILRTHLYGNPHSESDASHQSTEIIEDLRDRIVELLGLKLGEYVVCFVNSGREAFKTVIESFPFNRTSKFLCHSSLRENLKKLSKYASIPSVEFDSDIPSVANNVPNLFAFVLSPDSQFAVDSRDEIYSLVDATRMVSQGDFRFNNSSFDAIVFDTDAVFGYPKVGVLLMKPRLIDILVKPYFGGGTLVYALTESNKEKMRLIPSYRFEDGSPHFLDLVVLSFAFDAMDAINWKEINPWITKLSQQVNTCLRNGIKKDGTPALETKASESFPIYFRFASGTDTHSYLASAKQHNIHLGISNKGDYLKVSAGWSTTENDIEQFCVWVNSQIDHLLA